MFTEVFPIVGTADIARARRFYEEALGAEVTHEATDDGAPVYVGLTVGPSHMGLSQDLKDGSHPPPRGSVWLYADNCQAATDRLRRFGAEVLDEPRQGTDGWIARVRDPDGNELLIAERRGPAADAHGSIGARLISPEPEQYTRPEYERRFLVAASGGWRALVEPYSKQFDDLYIRHSHLRLRTLTDSATGREFIKLTKKLVTGSPYEQLVGSIPLSPMEYEFIAALPGDQLRKIRHYHFHDGNVFSIDVFERELAGLVLCEVEAATLDALMRLVPPSYCAHEVTADPFFTGGNLSRASRGDLVRRLAELNVELEPMEPA